MWIAGFSNVFLILFYFLDFKRMREHNERRTTRAFRNIGDEGSRARGQSRITLQSSACDDRPGLAGNGIQLFKLQFKPHFLFSPGNHSSDHVTELG